MPRPVRRLRRVTAGTTAAALLLLGAPLALQHPAPAGRQPAAAPSLHAADLTLTSGHPRTHRWRGHPGRRIHHYTVRRGDTATGLAVRFHAWTAELLALNHLTARSTLYVGEKLRIPVVVAAARKARRRRAHHAQQHHAQQHHAKPHHAQHHAKPHHTAHPAKPKHAKPHPTAHHKPHAESPHKAHHKAGHGWRHADASRATVRRVVVRTARRHGVHPRLALAIAWQESGWQQHRVSASGALGVMQVMPATGRWLSLQVGRRLHLRGLHDNVTAGVVLLKILRAQTGPRKTMAGYYQGLASVRRYGMSATTRSYVASVRAIRKRLKHGWNPA